MDIAFKLPDELQQAIYQSINVSIQTAIKQVKQRDNCPEYMTKAEAAKYLHVSAPTLNTWAKNGITIPVIDIDGLKRYKRTDLDEFMKEHKQQ